MIVFMPPTVENPDYDKKAPETLTPSRETYRMLGSISVPVFMGDDNQPFVTADDVAASLAHFGLTASLRLTSVDLSDVTNLGSFTEESKENTALTLEVIDLTMNTLAVEVYVGLKKVKLTPKEYDMLKYFLLNPGECLSREQILFDAWGIDPQYQSNRLVDVHMRNLRDKIPELRTLITTVRSRGYRLDLANDTDPSVD